MNSDSRRSLADVSDIQHLKGLRGLLTHSGLLPHQIGFPGSSIDSMSIGVFLVSISD